VDVVDGALDCLLLLAWDNETRNWMLFSRAVSNAVARASKPAASGAVTTSKYLPNIHMGLIALQLL
jgi:hypothetical protein